MKKITIDQINELANSSSISPAMLRAFLDVESGGKGFDESTGKLIIQFEPAWFKKMAPYAPSGKWSVNKVEIQSKEWVAFNDAFAKDPQAAMLSTSIGLPQILGINFSKCGFDTVNAMWDTFKEGEYKQVKALCTFIKNEPKLYQSIQKKDFFLIAYYYNGPKYKELAKKYGREPYDISLKKAYLSFSLKSQ